MKEKRHPKWVIPVIIASVVLLLLVLNVSIEANPNDGGGCYSIAFDKLPMLMADKAVICVDGERYEITDTNLVDQITDETMCATNTDLCFSENDRWIELYCGKTLIRRMRWEDHHDSVIVYEADIAHWVFPSMEGYGMVTLSDELLSKLYAVLPS